MLKTLCALLIFLFVLAAPAYAVTIMHADGVTPIKRFQRLVDSKPNMPTVSGVVRIRFGRREFTAPAWYSAEKRQISVRKGSPLRYGIFWHELGHDYESHRLSNAGYARWARDLRVPYGRYERLGVEYFADWYAACAMPSLISRYRDGTVDVEGYGLTTTRRRMSRSCRRIWRY